MPETETDNFRWIKTGDEVLIDKNNDLFVVDRLKEIMKVRGFQVAPAELEGHLLDHPYVSDVCVVGVPDEYSGEVPMAFIAPSSKARELIKTGPQGVSEVKKAICKVRFDVGYSVLQC
jgi:acyl-CoA synthetase (AMP-forming)/AMP-acid ligase II